MTKKVACFIVSCMSSLLLCGQTEDSIAHTLLVADYDYTCRTSNASGEDVDVGYGLTLQVGRDVACTMGRKFHDGEDDKSERLLYVPTTWQNYPEGKTTSVETVPPNRFFTTEKTVGTKWTLLAEWDTICGHPCQKAEGEYGGRTWTAWFAERLPSRFGPWRLGGLPGLILRAVSDDGIHRFECRKVEAVKEAITYSVPEGAVRCPRAKFVKLRNRIFGNSNYVSNPMYYIKSAEMEGVFVMDGMVMMGSVLIDMKPAKFQPLDY